MKDIPRLIRAQVTDLTVILVQSGIHGRLRVAAVIFGNSGGGELGPWRFRHIGAGAVLSLAAPAKGDDRKQQRCDSRIVGHEIFLYVLLGNTDLFQIEQGLFESELRNTHVEYDIDRNIRVR